MKKALVILMAASFGLVPLTTGYAKEKQVIAGAGPSTNIVKMFFESFSTLPDGQPYVFEVPPKSIKHAGGIKASGTYVFGRTGRPLNAKEKQLNKGEIFLAQIPVAIVVGKDTGVTRLDMKQLEAIITGQVGNWRAVGGADHEIFVVGREPTEALFTILKGKYPLFNQAKFDKVFKKDNAIVNFMKSPHGKYAIAFGAKPNFENTDEFKMVAIEGFEVGVSLGLVYDQSNDGNQLVNAVKTHARSHSWAKTVSDAGYMPPGS
ncbi:hypothetical protein DSCA_29460 [Desulfosarcina alkanivorans]|uniref:PBP domain-containing protein n=1 Tax=Desulfosarcina alkanivorans TaxID=571177 RepID=A0A5K7YIN2_9BACT|nr:substrate-binding domain-containing protein [Desulfosarcina alkanivorans]BBO69016.1 hypothetical protein DSCA_29460 [Desulfosarcina alkanivorans]